MSACRELYWSSPDGLKLHARDYPGDGARLPVICLPGLTRNARDYAAFAERIAGARRVLALDLRGRGGSEPARDPASYVPDTYVADVRALLADQGMERFVAVGSSLGGLLAMLLAQAGAGVAAALLNDVGPELETAGMARIRGQIGRAATYPTWMHAARAVAEANGAIHPGWGIADWLAMAKRTHRLNNAGRIVLDYDQRIAEPLRAADDGGETAAIRWEALSALHDRPVLIVRGEWSDVLSAATAQRMAASLGRAELLTVPGVGHAPTLDEPLVAAAVDRLLDRAD